MAECELIIKANSSPMAVAFRGFLTAGKQYSEMVTAARDAGDSVAETFAIAMGMKALQEMILGDELIMQTIVFLRGSPMGFRTDCDHKDSKSQYDNKLLATIASEAAVSGLRLTGNEINIIQDQLYITQEGWISQLERLPGVTEPYCPIGTIKPDEFEERKYMTKGYKDSPPKEKTKITATVSAQASCYVWGRFVEVQATKTDTLDSRVQVATIADFPDDVVDQIKGKVKARMWRDLFLKCCALSKAGPDGLQMPPAKLLEPVPQPQKQIEQSSTTTPEDKPKEPPQQGRETQVSWNQIWKTEAIKVKHTEENPHIVIRMARMLGKADSAANMETILDEAKAAIGPEKQQISQRLYDEMVRYAQFRVEQIGAAQ